MVKTISDEDYNEFKKLKSEDLKFKRHLMRSLKQISEGKIIPV